MTQQQPIGRFVILAVTSLAMAGIALALPPIAQPLDYHDFAEQRMIIGIAHFGDVVSNFAYLAVALLGLRFLVSRDRRARPVSFADRLPYLVFFGAVAAISAGSAYYHLNPTNQTLLWDRLPMAVAFTAIFAAFVGDRIDPRAGTYVVLPIAVALGVVSLVYWNVSEAAGHGDLRLYFLVQALVFVLVPLICALFRGRHTSGWYVFYILVLYGLGLACEQLDDGIYQILGGTVSGHTIKHLLTALAIYMVVPMLRRSDRQRLSSPSI